jgi:hypothetical protein
LFYKLTDTKHLGSPFSATKKKKGTNIHFQNPKTTHFLNPKTPPFQIQELLHHKSKRHGTKPMHLLLLESFPKRPRA